MKEKTLNALEAFIGSVETFALNVASQQPELQLMPFVAAVVKKGKELRDQLQEEAV